MPKQVMRLVKHQTDGFVLVKGELLVLIAPMDHVNVSRCIDHEKSWPTTGLGVCDDLQTSCTVSKETFFACMMGSSNEVGLLSRSGRRV